MKRPPPETFTLSLQLPQPVREVALIRFGDRQAIHQQDIQSSYERGRLEGERSLSTQLIQQRAEVMELQTGVLGALRDAMPRVVRECEAVLVALAVESARKVIAGLEVSPAQVEAVVKEALAQVEAGTEFTVQIHPDDLVLLQRINSPLLLPQGGPERIQFQPAPQLSRGGCVVQTRFGVIDARRETKFELVEGALAS